MRLEASLLSLLLLNICRICCSPAQRQLLVIMLDGFRWNYFDQPPEHLPGFQSMFREGVRAKWVNPIFPTSSYPSWTTISTGLYAENHGIIGNLFYDRMRQLTFDISNHTSTALSFWWEGAEPIWITATKQGLKAAAIMWSRCDIPYNGVRPDLCISYHPGLGWQSMEYNLDLALEYLEEGYELVMVYEDDIDNTGHKYGPHSQSLKQEVKKIDMLLGKFIQDMKDKDLYQKVNVVIVSDHGMTWVGEHSGVNYVPIQDYINLRDVQMILGWGSMAAVIPNTGKKEKVLKKLKLMPGVNAYAKAEIPERLHYKHNIHVQDILLLAQPGYMIKGAQSHKQHPRDLQRSNFGGIHGYDPAMQDMRAIFVAWGPDFRKNYTNDPIEMVDFYQVFTYILGIKPQPHNGTWSNVKDMFIDRKIMVASSGTCLRITVCHHLSSPLLLWIFYLYLSFRYCI